MRYFLVLIAAVFMVNTLESQISIQLGFNVERQPMWGPTGYDHVEYYYLPDIEVYYNVPQQRFFYYKRGVWTSSSSLPHRYRDYDLYSSYKVVVNDRSPYRNHRFYRDKYSSYRGRNDQQWIRDSRDSRYYSNKNHPEHKNWKRQQKNNDRSDRENEREGSRGRK